jgi:hypothetical protein
VNGAYLTKWNGQDQIYNFGGSTLCAFYDEDDHVRMVDNEGTLKEKEYVINTANIKKRGGRFMVEYQDK